MDDIYLEDVLYNDEGRNHYADLERVLGQAFDQAATGKGKERHARGNTFRDQDLMQIIKAHGLAFATGQIEKKAREACHMADKKPYIAKSELLGIIVYAAGAYLAVEDDE